MSKKKKKHAAQPAASIDTADTSPAVPEPEAAAAAESAAENAESSVPAVSSAEEASASEPQIPETDTEPAAEPQAAETIEEQPAEETPAAAAEDEPYIIFDDVYKTYIMGETQIHALDGVDFEIKKGEFVIVVGASGAGKSTILNILGGMDNLTSGRIVVDGAEVSGYSNKEMILYRRYDVGFVFQFYNLVQNLTAKENVELATQVSKNPLDVDETLKAVGLEDRASNFPSQLSGGEQQRVAIARALAKNPKLLLCDEPTGALDYNTGKAILQLLQDTAKKNGMTVILITHNFALTGIGDRVITVKSGKVASMELNPHPMDIRDVEW